MKIMKTYKAQPMAILAGETITKVSHGNPIMERLPPYNGYTLYTASGREFVIWNSMGETNLNEILEK